MSSVDTDANTLLARWLLARLLGSLSRAMQNSRNTHPQPCSCTLLAETPRLGMCRLFSEARRTVLNEEPLARYAVRKLGLTVL